MRAAEFYAKMADLTRQAVPFVLATITAAQGSSPRGVGARMLILADGTTVETVGGGVLEKQVVTDALACLASGASRSETYQLRQEGEHALGALCGGEATVFLEVHAPDRTLIIVGAGHVGQRLCAIAKLLDYIVVVLDPRQEMVSRERFPQADQLICGDPARTAELCSLGEDSHIVIVTHSHQHDAAALRAVIDSPVAYVGMIGSANKVRAIFAQLADDGVEPELLARVHSPIGLDIGAETPAELALCIMAEIVAESYGKLAAPAGSSVKEQPKEARTT
jgi:xanthine dehydrogenase accessory factor